MTVQTNHSERSGHPMNAGWKWLRTALYAARLLGIGALWGFASVGIVVVVGLHLSELPTTITLPAGAVILDGPLGVIALVSALVGIALSR
ncbi:hypothetical protein A7X86_13640 [Stenotrophomonas maltophilia]|nr:hypothetical protein A7X86_13640 [Stenotrophomonas maltophilia]